jgi:hypothetical protein
MDNEIKILCPGRKCSKCQRMISRVEEAVALSGNKANIVIVDKLEELLEYHTWILPTLIINEKIVARGYVPSVNMIQEYFK